MKPFAVDKPTPAELAEIEAAKAKIKAEHDKKQAEALKADRLRRKKEHRQKQVWRDSIARLERRQGVLGLEARAKERAETEAPRPVATNGSRRTCHKCGREITSIRNRCYVCDPGQKPGPKPKEKALPAPASRPVASVPAKARPVEPKYVQAVDVIPSPIAREIEALQRVAAALEGLDIDAVCWVLSPFIRCYGNRLEGG